MDMGSWSLEVDFKDGNKPTYLGEFNVELPEDADDSTAIGILNSALCRALTADQKTKLSGGFAIYYDRKRRMFKRENISPCTNDQQKFTYKSPRRYPYQKVGNRIVAIGC